MPDAPVPPHSQEAEEGVLGAMMLSPRAIDAVAEVVTPDDFYRGSNGKIFAALMFLQEAGEPADAITVAEELKRRGELDEVGGKRRLHELAATVPAPMYAPHYAEIVHETATRRNLIALGMDVTRMGWENGEPAAALLDEVQERVFGLSRSRFRSGIPSVGETIGEEYERLRRLYEEGRDVIGVPTGLTQLDLMTAGLQPGNLIVLAARPSMGKTGLALGASAYSAVHLDAPVLLFTLEMSMSEVRQRLLSLEAFVDLHRLRTGKLDKSDWASVTNAVSKLEHAPLYVHDQGDLTMVELRARARQLKLKCPELCLVVVDYLQLMVSGVRADSRVLEVGQISRALKILARELEVPVLAVSQLSRKVEERHDKRPLLSDLRESGNIEQDADVVMFLYREEYYDPEDPEVEGLAELNVAKHRNGPTGTVKLTFVKRYARFSDRALPGDMARPE